MHQTRPLGLLLARICFTCFLTDPQFFTLALVGNVGGVDGTHCRGGSTCPAAFLVPRYGGGSGELRASSPLMVASRPAGERHHD